MPLIVATHDGPFHADDVMAVALVRVFVDPDARVIRSRDPARWEEADVVVDVGGRFDPVARRFDHHQRSYTGPRSSAGMVLDWLEPQLPATLVRALREGCMDYLDAVDNGRRTPDPQVPCFARIVAALADTADSAEAFDRAFLRAVQIGEDFLRGMRVAHERTAAAEAVVVAAMERARGTGSNLLLFERYIPWKEPYFKHGGADHPTEFVLFPGLDGSWRVVAIPPSLGSFEQKCSLPASWAGLGGADLAAVTGVEGSIFCHKNRFVAGFRTLDDALEALASAGLVRGPQEETWDR